MLQKYQNIELQFKYFYNYNGLGCDKNVRKFFIEACNYMLDRGWIHKTNDVDTFIDNMLSNDMSALCCYESNKLDIIGVIGWYYNCKNSCWVGCIYVKEEYRHKGVFLRLWEEFLMIMKDIKASKVQLGTYVLNEYMIDLNNKLGLKEDYRVFSGEVDQLLTQIKKGE